MEKPTPPLAVPSEAASETTAMPDEWCARHFDHLSPDLAATMPATMARMRELHPVARSEEHGGFWVVSGYDEALAVAQDWAAFSSAQGLNIPRAQLVVRNLPVEADPPEQRVYKRLINPYFTPAAVEPWAEATRALADRLIDSFIESGSCEFMNEFARPFPSLAFFQLAINAPEEDLEKVAYMASKSSTPDDPESRECWQGLFAWIRDFTRARKDAPPRGDVVDAVVRAEIDGRPITEQEIIGTVQLLVLGGLETTAGALGLMLDRFCADPSIPALLRERPELIPSASLELLRLDPSFVAVARTATRDVEVGGCPMKAGDRVLIHWASANRDVREFPDADSFDPARERNRHLSFGAGPHRCAGSNLARMNLRVALEQILTRMHDIRLADGAKVKYHRGLTRSPDTLPITFTPGPRLTPAS
ncbi:cytochrome P450 [Actinocorallia sp. A-T 12471]|uniref:cytochrome P450 n=1 Tax=Actinocorallia sp. A-T 12471 TaxID=3089813 RepID=UPI0029D1E55F|nr:cytochrome P450 [Actinocorallia sp. A-T 12471]MDX6745131.1 cytochrome P450 [Actinocorallia sp. A-T 12471]